MASTCGGSIRYLTDKGGAKIRGRLVEGEDSVSLDEKYEKMGQLHSEKILQ